MATVLFCNYFPENLQTWSNVQKIPNYENKKTKLVLEIHTKN